VYWDGIYGIVAGFGITYITSFLLSQQSWLRLFGGVYICYLGIRSFTSKPEISVGPVQSKGLMLNYFSTFLLTLTNPMTILSFAAVFAGFGIGQEAQAFSTASLMVLGVITGSAIWWLMLSQVVGLFHRRITPGDLLWINRLSGAVLFCFGILALVSQFFQ